MGKFANWLVTEADDMVAAWKAQRAAAGWGEPPASTASTASFGQKPFQAEPVKAEPGAKKPVTLPPQVMDLLLQGFQSGSTVPDNLVRLLDLHGRRRSLVADSLMRVTGHAYPFYAEKRAGVPTGKILFVKHFPIDKFMREISDLS